MSELSERLEYFRDLLENEKPISWGELHELQGLAEEGLIPDGDVVLLEWAGVPEFGEGREAASRNA